MNKFQAKRVENKNWKSSVICSLSNCKFFIDLGHSGALFQLVLVKLDVKKTQNMFLDILQLHLLNLLYGWTYLLYQLYRILFDLWWFCGFDSVRCTLNDLVHDFDGGCVT